MKSAGFKYRKAWGVIFVFLLLLLCYPATGYSLDNNRWSAGLNFNFYPPGARALGMGGAFVASADDATAAVTNPAGLAQLPRRQIAVEGRYTSTDGQSGVSPWAISSSNYGYDNYSTDIHDQTAIDFGAISTPIFNNYFTLCLFYDKPMNFSDNYYDVSTYPTDPYPVSLVSASADFSADEGGVALATAFANGKILVGASIGVVDTSLSLNDQITITGYPVVQTGSASNDRLATSERVGILVKPTDKLSLGLAYTRMPQLSYDINFYQNGALSGTTSSTFKIPDNLAFGAAYHVHPNWVLLFEGKYVWYSQLLTGFTHDYNYSEYLPYDTSYSLDNTLELHFGTEYVLSVLNNIPLALRAGIWYEPAHDIKYTGQDPEERNLLNGGQDLVHYCFGTGTVLFNHYQIDIGADITKDSRNVALSMVYQF